MQELDFNLIKRHYLPITLNDENKTHLDIMTPTKRLYSAILTLPDMEGEVKPEDLDQIYYVCAQLMSRNKQSRKVTREDLKECLDYEDLALFMAAYVNFLAEIASEKN